MLLNAVVIVLREVLEAALLASMLLAIGRQAGLNNRWFIYALFAGFCGAWLYAHNFAVISEWFEYTGQELVNGSSQIFIYISIFVLVILLGKARQGSYQRNLIYSLMTLIIVLAITREGAEISIYLSGFISSKQHIASVITGGIIGACIGASTGIIVYYTLVHYPGKISMLICKLMLGVIGAGILAQAIPQFSQADWLPAQQALWDSSSLLPEQSLIGQLMYAIAGYEATPTLLHVIIYNIGLLSIIGIAMTQHFMEKRFANT